MSVYVDKLFCWPARGGQAFRVGARHGHLWCHLWADSITELLVFAKRLGLRSTWLQGSAGCFPHFDLVPPLRAKALSLGALESEPRKRLQPRR